MSKKTKEGRDFHRVKGSSSIQGIEVNGEDLTITFINGGKYVYADVGRDRMEEMIMAESPGSFFAREIRPNYEGVRIDVDDPEEIEPESNDISAEASAIADELDAEEGAS